MERDRYVQSTTIAINNNNNDNGDDYDDCNNNNSMDWSIKFDMNALKRII